MSEVDRIYQKYIGVFYEVDGGGTWIDLSAVRYALRAALRELAGTPNPDRQGSPALDQHQYEVLAKQIERLNDWLFEHAPDLAHDPYTDTADAMIAAADRLRGTVERMRIELAAAIDERNVADQAVRDVEVWLAQVSPSLSDNVAGDTLTLHHAIAHAHNAAIAKLDAELAVLRSTISVYKVEIADQREVLAYTNGMRDRYAAELDALRQQLAQMDADNAKLAQELAAACAHSTGVGDFGIADYAPDAAPRATADGAASDGLVWDDDLADWVEGLEKGRHDWRKLPRPVRWQLIANVVRQIPASESASTAWFDAHRPGWMTSARAAALTFGDGRWERVLAMVRSGEVVRR